MLNRKAVVFFNRDKVRSELVALNYVEARRLKGPIYCALVKELYEEGCKIAARHLENLAEKENFFYETKVIRDRVCDNTELLMALFDNVRVAEKVQILKQTHSYQTTTKCLYQIVQLLEPYKVAFDWLLEDIYSIIIPICENFERLNEPNAEENIARIYFKTATFYSLRENSLPHSIKFMEKAMKLSRNEAWLSEYITEREFGVYPTLHLVAGREVAGLLLRYAKTVAAQDSKAAAEAAQKAAISLAEVGVEKNKVQYLRALLSRAKYLLQLENYEAASKLLLKVHNDLDSSANVEEPKVFSDLYLYEGVCLWNQKRKTGAIAKLEKALKFAITSCCKRREAEVLVAIGKVYAASILEQGPARKAFTQAKQIFGELGDELNRKKAHYMLAKLKADEIFPYFMDLLKDGQEKFCGFHNLRQWKNSCKEFWNTMGVEELKEDEIYCLLEDDIKNTFAWKERTKSRITNPLRTTLRQNYFQFNNKIYKQTNGLGMGNPTSAILMEVFMQGLEEQCMNELTTELGVPFYARYVDGVKSVRAAQACTSYHEFWQNRIRLAKKLATRELILTFHFEGKLQILAGKILDGTNLQARKTADYGQLI